MKKGKSITLLSIVCFIMAFLIVMTFVRFPIGVKNYNSVLGAIELDYDIAGGTAYEVSLAKDNLKDIDDPEDVVDTLEARLIALGYSTYSIKAFKSEGQPDEEYSFRVETRGKTNAYGEQDTSALLEDIKTVFSYGVVKFYGGTSSNPDTEILTDGKVIENAEYAGVSQNDSSTYLIKVEFTDYGYDKLAELLDNNNDSYYLKISLEDQDLLSGTSPISKSYISDKSIFVTCGSEELARRTALLISSGGLEYKFEVPKAGFAVSSPLGENVPLISTIVICSLLFLTVIALIVLYKGLGISLALSSILFMLIEVIMLIAVPGIKLSLGGIIGIVSALILTVDGQIVLGKRVKEGFMSGKTVKSAIKNGFARSVIPTVNISVIAGIVSLITFIFANGSLACFGITLGIGSILALITNLVFVRMFNSLLLPIFGKKETFLGLKKEEKEAI